MPRDLDLKRRLELAGLTVIEVAGWQTRGKDDLNAVGAVHHHTGGAVGKTAPSLGVVINGRSDLPGPLCNVYGARTDDLAVHLVAAGKANHAGAGGWHGHSGNASVYGLEEEHSGGPNEPVAEKRIDRMARVHAAFAFGRFTADEVCQHREWAPGRKPDFTAHFIDADDFRRRVADHLLRMEDPSQEDDMTTIEEIRAELDVRTELLAKEIRAVGRKADVTNTLVSDIHPDADAARVAAEKALDVADDIQAALAKLDAGDGASAKEILDALAERLLAKG